jgi:hypothetical protein
MTDIEALVAERATKHGDFTYQASITQDFKRIAHAAPRWPVMSDVQREGMEMILHKAARILAGDPYFADHWDDIGGYAKITRDRLNG